MEHFYKYHGLGNDFVVLDRRASGRDLETERAVALCDRRRGIGADGVLVILPPQGRGALARMVVHNADGSVAEMCGNGLRCVVKHLAEHSPDRPVTVPVETGAGLLTSEVVYRERAAQQITVDMGPARVDSRDESVAGFVGTRVDMGNPHFVLLGTPPSEAERVGALLERHAAFPKRTNVECCEFGTDGTLKVTVWERGVGITEACGTGACAAVVAGALAGRTPFGQWITVRLPGGALEVFAPSSLSPVRLRGPAAFVYEGELS